MLKVNSWLPLFPGFYGTWYEPNEDMEIEYIDSERQEKGLNPFDWHNNWHLVNFNYEDIINYGNVYIPI